MDVGRRSSVVAGSVWESRMKLDEVKGGIKVFNGDQGNSEEQSSSSNGVTAATRARLKRGHQAGGAAVSSAGKRKTWKSETVEVLEKNPIQISKGKTEPLKNSDEQSKELSVSVDGIKKSPTQARRLRSEGSKENGVASDKNERSPIGIRKPRYELLRSGSDLGKNGGKASEGIERNSAQLRKVKSESNKGLDASSGNAVQLRKAKSESVKASLDESDKGIDRSAEVIEKIPVEMENTGSDENCKEFGVCQEMVILSGVSNADGLLVHDGDDQNGGEEDDVVDESAPKASAQKHGGDEEDDVVDESAPKASAQKHDGDEEDDVVDESAPKALAQKHDGDEEDDVDESAPKASAHDADDQIGDEEDDVVDELEEEMDEEIEVEVEKKSVDIKEVNAAEEKLTTRAVKVNEEKAVKVNEVKKLLHLDRREVKKLLHLDRREVKKLHQSFNKKPEPISVNLKKSPPVIKRATVHSNVPKYTSFADSNEYLYHSSFPETHSSRLQSLVDLVMWKDISRSVFVFGIGTFVILSSSYIKDINISFISVISYLGLIYLAAIFLFKSIICRGALEVNNANYVVGEEEATWLLKLVLPYLNELLVKIKALFSGDPATTFKLAVLLFVLARCGSSITIWTMSKVGFFGVFTLPKVCSLYSARITLYGKFWVRRFRDAWESCTHKKPLSIAIFLLVWNLSSVIARIWAAFILVVAFRYYQQKILVTDDQWVEDYYDYDDDQIQTGAEETFQGGVGVGVGGQRQGHVPSQSHSQVDITKQKKGF